MLTYEQYLTDFLLLPHCDLPLVTDSMSRVRSTTSITTLDMMTTIRWVVWHCVLCCCCLLSCCLDELLPCCYCIDTTNATTDTNLFPSRHHYLLVALLLLFRLRTTVLSTALGTIVMDYQSIVRVPTNNEQSTTTSLLVLVFSPFFSISPTWKKGAKPISLIWA